jgi:hypothetical protein
LQSIVSISAGAALLIRAVQLSLDRKQSIRLPSRLVDPAYAGQWIAEGAPIPVFQFPVSSNPTLTPHKLGVVSVFTREMLEASNIEAFVRSLLSESAALAIDKALFGAQADDGVTPPGLLNIVSPTNPANGVDKRENLMEDVSALIEAIASRGGGTDAVFVCAPAEAAAMKVNVGPQFDYDILASMVLSSGTVICVEPRSLVATIGAIMRQFSVAEATLLHMEDTAPTDINSSDAMAYPTKSIFQLDSTALKMVLSGVDWKLRAAHVSWIQSANW